MSLPVRSAVLMVAAMARGRQFSSSIRMRILLLVVFLGAFTLSGFASAADGGGGLSAADRIRIAEARRVADELGDGLWPGWSSAPFGVLLITREEEFLVHHASPGNDFTPIGYDSLLGSDVYVRDRIFDPHLLATFPAVGGISTIVIGQAERTDASHSTRWVITLLHEHFHQLQDSQPDYYTAVNALNLARGDSTGMWMLNFPFHYDDPVLNERFAELCLQLRDAVTALDKGAGTDEARAYVEKRRQFRGFLTADDFKYFSFQVWKEGIARYTEYIMARRAAGAYQPTEAFEGLPDFESFESDADEMKANILTKLAGMSLKDSRRTAFYPFGAAEGMLLDKLSPGWRAEYFTKKFDVEGYFGMTGD